MGENLPTKIRILPICTTPQNTFKGVWVVSQRHLHNFAVALYNSKDITLTYMLTNDG